MYKTSKDNIERTNYTPRNEVRLGVFELNFGQQTQTKRHEKRNERLSRAAIDPDGIGLVQIIRVHNNAKSHSIASSVGAEVMCFDRCLACRVVKNDEVVMQCSVSCVDFFVSFDKATTSAFQSSL